MCSTGENGKVELFVKKAEVDEDLSEDMPSEILIICARAAWVLISLQRVEKENSEIINSEMELKNYCLGKNAFDFKRVSRRRRKADPKIGEIKLDSNLSLASTRGKDTLLVISISIATFLLPHARGNTGGI